MNDAVKQKQQPVQGNAYERHVPCGIYEKYIKRLLDISAVVVALFFLWWLYLIIAFLIRIRLGTPVIFKQERPGREEKIFTLYKFRSMSDKRNEKGELLPDDERLTKFGRLLRSSSLDELPELINILRGDMSLVGPRPLLVSYLPYYTEEERHRHDVRPGLTGLAQVNGRNRGSWEEKFRYDLEYVHKITFLGDMKILFITVLKTVKRSDILVGSQIPAGRLDNVRKERNNVSV